MFSRPRNPCCANCLLAAWRCMVLMHACARTWRLPLSLPPASHVRTLHTRASLVNWTFGSGRTLSRLPSSMCAVSAGASGTSDVDCQLYSHPCPELHHPLCNARFSCGKTYAESTLRCALEPKHVHMRKAACVCVATEPGQCPQQCSPIVTSTAKGASKFC